MEKKLNLEEYKRKLNLKPEQKDFIVKYHEELKPVYFEHLDMISQTKFLHIDTEHKYAFNMMVECMALKTIPVFDKDPLLIGLEEGTHYVLKDSYNNSETYEEIIENKVTLQLHQLTD